MVFLFWWFDDIDDSGDFGNINNLRIITTQKLISYKDVNEWIKIFNIFNKSENYYDKDYQKNLNNERIYDIIPLVNNSCRYTKKQKVYTITNIKQLLEKLI